MRSPQIQHNTVATGIVGYWLSRLWLSMLGWKVEGEVPAHRKFVLIGAPHTSNWDFFIGMPALKVYRVKAFWMGKDSLFKGPLGPISRALGGIAIDRSSPQGVVKQMADRLREADQLVIGIPPKGTRGYREHWKSGFYHIAHEAGVPVVCGSIDFESKTVHMGLCLQTSGDVSADMDEIRQYYSRARAKFPELQDVVKLKEEDE